MMSPCEVVLDRVVAGESLTDEQTAHVAGCVDCARLARVPGLLASAAREPDPGAGFSARMQVGARGRMAVRKRQRIALASFATVAVGAAAVLFVTRPGHEALPGAMETQRHDEPRPQPPVTAEPAVSDHDLALDLVRVSDTDRVIRGEADWNDITHSMIPYRAMLAKHGARKGAR
jgi:hypothetical protein